jgi:hypothetical protein
MNDLLHTGHIDLWLLVVGLFFPRLALFVAWLFVGDYPPNPLPLLFNFIGWLFVPRFLMAYYVYVNAGPNNLWFWAYIILGIVGIFGESGYVRRRAIRRTTVTRDGNTTTTVEEEEV